MTHIVPLAQALSPLRDVYEHLISAAVRWQDGRARSAEEQLPRSADERPRRSADERPRRSDPDHFALVCVAADAGFGRAVAPTRWTRTDVYHVLRCDVPNWCSLHSCLWPAELPEVMWEWFDFLAETGRLDAASDPLWELRKPLLCYGGLDERGRPRPDRPADPRIVECECHLPYRETVQLLNRLGLQCEQRGQSPTDVLRALVGEGTRHPGPDELGAMLRDLREDLRDIGSGGIPGFPYPEEDPPWD